MGLNEWIMRATNASAGARGWPRETQLQKMVSCIVGKGAQYANILLPHVAAVTWLTVLKKARLVKQELAAILKQEVESGENGWCAPEGRSRPRWPLHSGHRAPLVCMHIHADMCGAGARFRARRSAGSSALRFPWGPRGAQSLDFRPQAALGSGETASTRVSVLPFHSTHHSPCSSRSQQKQSRMCLTSQSAPGGVHMIVMRWFLLGLLFETRLGGLEFTCWRPKLHALIMAIWKINHPRTVRTASYNISSIYKMRSLSWELREREREREREKAPFLFVQPGKGWNPIMPWHHQSF